MGGNPWAVRTQQTGENLRAVKRQQTDENPRDVETQRTGVNPMSKFTRSHMPTSIETRGHTDNVRIGNDEEMSAYGNIFKKLCRGVDLWDTLNRR